MNSTKMNSVFGNERTLLSKENEKASKRRAFLRSLVTSSKWFFPFIMISFVMLLETWVFESIRGEWSTIISKTVTFSTFNLGFFLGMTLAMCLVISRLRNKSLARESKLYGFSFVLSLTYMTIVFPALFTNSTDALEFLSNDSGVVFQAHEVEYFQMYAVSWIIELGTVTWFLILVMRGDWRGVTIARAIAIIVKVVVYLVLIYAFDQYKDERLVLTMAYSTIALRIAEYLCYMFWVVLKHKDALVKIHQFFTIPKRDLVRLAKASLLLINPVIYNFALFLSWRLIYDISNDYTQILAVILPLFKMFLYGSIGITHCVPKLIMEKIAIGDFETVYKDARGLSKSSFIIGSLVAILMFIPLLILGTTQTFNSNEIDSSFYYNSLLIIGGIYCVLFPLIIQTDTLSVIMLSGAKTRGHTLLNVFFPLLSIIIIALITLFFEGLNSIWLIVGLVLIVNLKSIFGVFFNNWKFKRRKWLVQQK